MARYSEKEREFFRGQLRLLRKSRGFTKAGLSRELGLSEATIGTWENGKSFPAKYAMRLLCDFFGVKEKNLTGSHIDLQEYALYEGDRYICGGSLKEISQISGKSIELLRYYSYDSTQKRNPKGLAVIKVDDD